MKRHVSRGTCDKVQPLVLLPSRLLSNACPDSRCFYEGSAACSPSDPTGFIPVVSSDSSPPVRAEKNLFSVRNSLPQFRSRSGHPVPAEPGEAGWPVCFRTAQNLFERSLSFKPNAMCHAFLEGRSRPFRNRVDAVVLPLSFLTRETSSSVVTRALMDGTSKGDFSVCSGERENVLPSFLRINTLPDTSALSSTLESFWRASEYV